MLLPRRRMGRSLLFPLLLWAAPPLPGANVFSLPSITLPGGAEGQELFLHCEHDELLTGFSVAIRYDFSKIAITDAADLAAAAASGVSFSAAASFGPRPTSRLVA